MNTPVATEAGRLPTLPADLLTLIGSYGLARTNGESEVERLHRWQQLIAGIKQYAADCISSLAEPGEAVAVPFVQQTAPERIWLAVSDNAHDAENCFPDDYAEISWSDDEPLEVCVPYIRADLSHPAAPVGVSEEMVERAIKEACGYPMPLVGEDEDQSIYLVDVLASAMGDDTIGNAEELIGEIIHAAVTAALQEPRK
jgi:hypothetical protein